MQKEYLKFEDALCFEGMTSIRAIIEGINSGVNNRQISSILYDKEKSDKNAKTLGYLKAVSSKYGFELQESDADSLEMPRFSPPTIKRIGKCKGHSPSTLSVLSSAHTIL